MILESREIEAFVTLDFVTFREDSVSSEAKTQNGDPLLSIETVSMFMENVHLQNAL